MGSLSSPSTVVLLALEAVSIWFPSARSGMKLCSIPAFLNGEHTNCFTVRKGYMRYKIGWRASLVSQARILGQKIMRCQDFLFFGGLWLAVKTQAIISSGQTDRLP